MVQRDYGNRHRNGYDGLLTRNLDDLNLLKISCQQPTGGTYAPNETVATCWDADRLDLPRVFIQVKPQLLCTKYAKDPVMVEAANQRVQRWLSKRDNYHYNEADNWSFILQALVAMLIRGWVHT